MKQAEDGIANLTDKVDSLIIIPNDRLKFVTDQKITFANAFGIADDVLKQAVSSISELVGYSEHVIINLDFADVSAIMTRRGPRAYGRRHCHRPRQGRAGGAWLPFSSPLLETSINGATGVLINITGSPDLGLDDVETAANIVMEAANPEANIIFGAAFDDELRGRDARDRYRHWLCREASVARKAHRRILRCAGEDQCQQEPGTGGYRRYRRDLQDL